MKKGNARSLFNLPVDDEELKKYIEQNTSCINTTETREDVLYAHKIAADNFLYSIAPNSRLKYLEDTMKKDGYTPTPKSDSDQVLDCHAIASILQGVYDIDMNVASDLCAEMILGNFAAKRMEDAGLVKSNDGHMEVTEEGLRQADEFKRKIIESGTMTEEQFKKFEEAMIESIKNIDSITEQSGFNYIGRVVLTEDLKLPLELAKKEYISLYGEPKRGKYICPINEEIVKFCFDSIDSETGQKIDRKTNILVDYNVEAPYACVDNCKPDTKYIVLPSIVIDNNATIAICLLQEGVHTIKTSGDYSIKDFLDNKIEWFLKTSWDEGITMVVTERRLKELLTKPNLIGGINLFPAQAAYDIIYNTVLEAPKPEKFLHPIEMKDKKESQILGFSVYYNLTYPFGWYSLRELDKEDIHKMFNEKEPHKNPKLNWNSHLKGNAKKNMKHMVNVQRQKTMERFREDPRTRDILLRYYRQWENDFLS